MDLTAGLLCAALGYLLGAIPTGVLVARALGVIVYDIGSGHTGGLNVYRTTGKRWALALTALGDVALAALAVGLARTWFTYPWAGPLAGVMAIVGHNWSIYIGFRGGVGLSSIVGSMIVIAPLATLITAIILAVVFFLTNRALRHSARSTIVIMVLIAPLLWMQGQSSEMLALGVVGALPIIIKELGDFYRVYQSHTMPA